MTPGTQPSTLSYGKFEGNDVRDLAGEDLTLAYRQGSGEDRALIQTERSRRRVAERRRRLQARSRRLAA